MGSAALFADHAVRDSTSAMPASLPGCAPLHAACPPHTVDATAGSRCQIMWRARPGAGWTTGRAA